MHQKAPGGGLGVDGDFAEAQVDFDGGVVVHLVGAEHHGVGQGGGSLAGCWEQVVELLLGFAGSFA